MNSARGGPGYYQPGPDCRHTQVGYEVILLLPIKANDTDIDAEEPPYPLDRMYTIIEEEETKDMVLVPIATAFQLVGLLVYLVSAFVAPFVLGLVSR